MITLILAGMIPSFALAAFVAKRKHSLLKGIVAGMILIIGWTASLVAILILNGNPAQPEARTITREEMKTWTTGSEQSDGVSTLNPAPGGTDPKASHP